MHRGVQLILASSLARPAILVAGKGREGMFFISSVSSLSFQFLFLPCLSLSSPLLSLLFLLSLFSLSPFLWGTIQNDPQPQHNQTRHSLTWLQVKIWSMFKHGNLTQVTKYCAKEEKLLIATIFSIHLLLQESNYIFICEMWFQFWKSDMSRYGYLEAFQGGSRTSR